MYFFKRDNLSKKSIFSKINQDDPRMISYCLYIIKMKKRSMFEIFLTFFPGGPDIVQIMKIQNFSIYPVNLRCLTGLGAV